MTGDEADALITEALKRYAERADQEEVRRVVSAINRRDGVHDFRSDFAPGWIEIEEAPDV